MADGQWAMVEGSWGGVLRLTIVGGVQAASVCVLCVILWEDSTKRGGGKGERQEAESRIQEAGGRRWKAAGRGGRGRRAGYTKGTK